VVAGGGIGLPRNRDDVAVLQVCPSPTHTAHQTALRRRGEAAGRAGGPGLAAGGGGGVRPRALPRARRGCGGGCVPLVMICLIEFVEFVNVICS
jgi:hypothetical protein